jgi:hypothetical protein
MSTSQSTRVVWSYIYEKGLVDLIKELVNPYVQDTKWFGQQRVGETSPNSSMKNFLWLILQNNKYNRRKRS